MSAAAADDRDPAALRDEQARRAEAEAERAAEAPLPEEAEQHERRADKAAYLRDRLEQQAASERG